MSNCPPLVAMSVVTRWRSTFSSSVTHLMVTLGFLVVKSLVRPCILIMSPLFTVAMVSVVCAIAWLARAKAIPTRAAGTCILIVSLQLIRQMRSVGHNALGLRDGHQRFVTGA